MVIFGLDGDYSQTSFVSLLIKLSSFYLSYISQKLTSSPLFLAIVAKNFVVPPYTSLDITTFSSGLVKSAIKGIAAIPDDIAKAGSSS
jgi:hypothetical protein